MLAKICKQADFADLSFYAATQMEVKILEYIHESSKDSSSTTNPKLTCRETILVPAQAYLL